MLAFCCALAALADPAVAGILTDHDESYQWRLCPAGRLIPIRPGYTDADIDPESIEIRADASRIVESGLSQFSGDVQLIRGNQSVAAEILTYDQEQGVFTAEGRTHIWNSGITWAGESATYDLNSEVTELNAGRYWLLDGRGRGHADHLRNDRRARRTELESVDYSTCPLSAESWRMSASRITLNHESDRGSAVNAVLRVRDVPVFYFPYVTFPISDKRKSGFLAPVIGSTNDSGIDARLPYYWNIAPNHDATITPRVLTDRGAMAEVEYRYLGRTFDGRANIEYLPGDSLHDNRDRSLFALEHNQFFFQRRGDLYVLFNNVSDDEYFEDFGSNINTTSQRFLDRRIQFDFRDQGPRGSVNVRSMVRAYQTIDPDIPENREPYRVLPDIKGRARYRMFGNFYANLEAQTSYFDRDVGLTGGRTHFEPGISYRYRKPYLRVEPKLSVHQTNYFLDDPDKVFDDTESRTVPKVTLDAEMFFERETNLFGANLLQTFEPIVQYLLIANVQQDDIPEFDTGRYQLSFRNLFRENRFSGVDRIGDANQIAAGVTSRLIDIDDGRELGRISVGQIYHFRDRDVALPRRAGEDDDVSELIAESLVNFNGGLSMRGIIQWDPNEPRTELAAVGLRFRPSLDTVFNVSYRLRRAVSDIRQTDVSFRVPILENLAVLGRWNFSLQENRTLEAVGGVEYESCCWGIRVVGRRFLLNSDGDFDTGVFLQAHFRGLGGFGRKSGSLLRRSIGGYTDPFQ